MCSEMEVVLGTEVSTELPTSTHADQLCLQTVGSLLVEGCISVTGRDDFILSARKDLVFGFLLLGCLCFAELIKNVLHLALFVWNKGG